MDRMGIRTLGISLVILSLSRLYSLENVESRHNCLYIESAFQEYQCPKEDLEVSVQITRNKDVILQCIENSRPFFDKEILPTLNLSESTVFELKYCYLNVSFYEILKKFNMNNVKKITFWTAALENDDRIINVNKDLFEHLESLEHLRLEYSTVNLSVDFLENTPNLRILTLNKNGLSQIDRYFNHVPKLQYLDISRNQIDSIPDGALDHLGSLVELLAWSNNLTEITKNMFNGLKSLKLLELSGNHIEHIDEDSFSNMHQLVNISLRSNSIQEIPKHIFRNNTFLENIRMSINPDLVLSDYLFANLTSLQTIDLSFDNLQDIPEHVFFNCSKLRHLTLKKNRLSTIPEKAFRDLTSLQKLDLSDNLLEALSHEWFSTLDNLEELRVSDNQLTALDSAVFQRMGKLKTLDLSRNKIGFIHHRALEGLISLTHLDLSYNRWNNSYRFYDLTPFNECLNLEELILRNNTIRHYPEMLALLRLKKIDLSSNFIEDLRLIDFTQERTTPVEADFSNNEIQMVDFNMAKLIAKQNFEFHDASHKTGAGNTIILDGNPVVCDCSNIDLIRYNNDQMKVIQDLVNIKQEKLICADKKDTLVTKLRPNQIDCPVLDDCPQPCTCRYMPYNEAVIVDCSFTNLTSYPDLNINDTRYQRTELNLRGNLLEVGPVDSLHYENVTYLDLSQNHISEISWIPPNIKELNLNGNNLRKLTRHFVDLLKKRTSLERVDLGGNLWDCNCDASDLQKYLIQHFPKVNSSNVYCRNSTTQLVELTDLCRVSALLTVLLPVVLTVLLFFTVALALYYRYQREIKIYLYAKNLCLWFVTEEELDRDKTYDVFISYAHQDEKFVVDQLLPELEQGQTPFKVCVHVRDWVPGEFIAKQVISSVKESRRTLVVLSNNFVDSLWGKLEFRTAHTQAISEGRARVIVVIYGDLNEDKLDDELKSYLKTNTYVKWGDKYFWNKLKYALPHSKSNFHAINRKQAKIMLKIDDKFDLINTPPSPANTSTPPITLDVSLLEANEVNINIPKVEGEDPLLVKKH